MILEGFLTLSFTHSLQLSKCFDKLTERKLIQGCFCLCVNCVCITETGTVHNLKSSYMTSLHIYFYVSLVLYVDFSSSRIKWGRVLWNYWNYKQIVVHILISQSSSTCMFLLMQCTQVLPWTLYFFWIPRKDRTDVH